VWAKSLDLNAAVRATSYSTSGYVTTWKVGATYNPIDDIRFRATRSRDIRAPNLSELFANGASNTNTVQDRFNNNAVTSYVGFTVGNPNLVPERADTTGLGVVLQPRFFPGFSASFDYYNIDLNNAISTLTAQQIVDQCFAGQQQYCSALTRGAGSGGATIFSKILIQPFNYVQRIARGYDIEASYNTRLDNIVDAWNGAVGFRFLATHFLKNYSNSGITGVPPTDSVGDNAGLNGGGGPPKWRYNINATYTNDPIAVSLTARGFSAGTQNNTYIACTSGCPVATSNNETINVNYMPGAMYFDANISYKIAIGEGSESQFFFNVKNLTNKDPAIYAQGPAGVGFLTQATNPSLYDQLGRVFRAGVRFKM
jgi:iron complex outermembrane receptor protein